MAKFVFARKNNKIIHISQISKEERGKNCGARCLLCGELLIAKMGEINKPHFAHQNNSNCNINNESALHIAAKEIIEREKKLTFPPVFYEYILKIIQKEIKNEEPYFHEFYYEEHPVVIKNKKEKENYFIYEPYNNKLKKGDVGEDEIKSCEKYKKLTVYFDKVESEKSLYGKIIDLVGYKNKSKVGIEIKVTHKVDEEKIKLLQKHNLPTIEIDLYDFYKNHIENFSFSELKHILIDSVENKKWIIKKDELKTVQFIENELESKFSIKNQKKRESIMKKLNQEKRKEELKIEREKYYNQKVRMYKNKEYKKIKTMYSIEKRKEDKLQENMLEKLRNSKTFKTSLIGKFVPGAEMYFNCNYSLWQLVILYEFIYLKKEKNCFIIGDIIEHFKKDKYIFFDKRIYWKSKEHEDIRSIEYVIQEYLLYLQECKILVEDAYPYIIDGPYYLVYIIINPL